MTPEMLEHNLYYQIILMQSGSLGEGYRSTCTLDAAIASVTEKQSRRSFLTMTCQLDLMTKCLDDYR